MSFIKSFLYDGVHEWWAMKQHTFIGMIVIRITNLFTLVRITIPQTFVDDTLDFQVRVSK